MCARHESGAVQLDDSSISVCDLKHKKKGKKPTLYKHQIPNRNAIGCWQPRLVSKASFGPILLIICRMALSPVPWSKFELTAWPYLSDDRVDSTAKSDSFHA
jgi:hypothetical protein